MKGMESVLKEPSIETADVEAFRSQLRGVLLTPGDGGYDEARRIWNAMIDRRPALIARCAGVADVMRSVAFARERGLPLAVRGGGHNIAGNAVCDGGLMIDLSRMRSVWIDSGGGRARVEGGATLVDLDHEAQAFGLATPLGINSTTGVAGLTLGGGFGWLSRKFGLTIDNLLSADLVTADGRAVRASEEENPDLFWAIRGGGGNFGVVTSFEFRLHRVGPEVLAGLIVFPIGEARGVLERYREFAGSLPDELNAWCVLRKAPPLPFLPPEVHGREILALAVFGMGDIEKAKGAFAPVRGFGRPVGEHVGPVPFTAWQKVFDPLLSFGARNYWKSHNFTGLEDSALDLIVRYASNLPSPHSEVFLALLGGQTARVAPDATAYAMRDAKFVLNVHARWERPEEDEPCVGWAREFFHAAAPLASGGAYINFMTEEEGDRIAAVYGPNHARLIEVKDRYDPENLFSLNQNIRPSGRRSFAR